MPIWHSERQKLLFSCLAVFVVVSAVFRNALRWSSWLRKFASSCLSCSLRNLDQGAMKKEKEAGGQWKTERARARTHTHNNEKRWKHLQKPEEEVIKVRHLFRVTLAASLDAKQVRSCSWVGWMFGLKIFWLRIFSSCSFNSFPFLLSNKPKKTSGKITATWKECLSLNNRWPVAVLSSLS